MITWGMTGRGTYRSATVFCMCCGEVIVRDIPPNEAKNESEKAKEDHKCSVETNDLTVFFKQTLDLIRFRT